MQISVSSLQDVGVVELALQLYTALDNCVLDDSQPAGYVYLVFQVMMVIQEQETNCTYEVKENGFHDVVIPT